MSDELRRLMRFASAEKRHALRRDLLEALLAPISAGASLSDACLVASREHPSRVLRWALARLARELDSGRRLSESLAGLAPLTDEMLVSAARIGERSGRMTEALAACERVLEARLALARGLADAVLQPLVSMACAVAVVVLLLLAGVARSMLLTRHAEPPGGMMSFVADHPFVVAGAITLGALGLALAWRALIAQRGQRWLDAVPLVADLRRELALGMLCRQVALLVESGTPLDEALASALPVLPAGSDAREALESAAARIQAGEPAASAAEHLGAVPLVGAVLSAPGADGLASRMARVARWHEAEAARITELAHALASSLATVAAGIACGAVVILAWGGYFGMATHFVN